MRTLMCVATTAIAIAVYSSQAFAQEPVLEAVRLAPDDLEWGGDPDAVARVDIAGDNETPGMYAYRVRFPEGFRNQPHFHPDDRIVTVIAGTLHMGYGRQLDEGAMRPLPAGSVWTEPGNQLHFVWAQDGEVIIQVIGVGPSGTTQVEP
jgi:quercetin dioxygenase-like cupin family protein